MAVVQREQRAPRFRRRFSVSFGPAYPLGATGFSVNVSARGLSMTTGATPAPATRLFLEVRRPNLKPCRLEGTVAWVRRGLAALGMPNTVGVVLARSDESWLSLITDTATPGGPSTSARSAPAANAMPKAGNNIPVSRLRPARVSTGVDAGVGAPRLQRFGIAIPMRFGTDGSLKFQGTIHNISASGFAFTSEEIVPTGSRMFFAVDLGSGVSARGDALVVWQRESARLGDMGARLAGVDEAWYRLVMKLSTS